MSIEWKEEYRTGFEKIDSQHLRLFECVTEMDSILGGGEINHTAVHDLMGVSHQLCEGAFFDRRKMHERSRVSNFQTEQGGA